MLKLIWLHFQIVKSGDEDSGLRAHRGDLIKISYELKIKDTEDLIEKQDHVKIYLGDNEVSTYKHHLYKVLLLSRNDNIVLEFVFYTRSKISK